LKQAIRPTTLSSDLSVHQLIDAQAERNPLAPAVYCGTTVLTYGELITRANQLAHQLVELGVSSETLVGLCVARSVDMIVGVLGILKAGAAFVPLDPAYPSDRLAFMVEDSAVPVVVAQQSTWKSVPAFSGKVVLLEQVASAAHVSGPPDVVVRPDQLAYVVYTSGSTGRPKGVMIEHESIVSFLAWTRSRFSAAQMSHVLCSSSLSFDVSFFEIFAPLSAGGALVIVRDALELLTTKPAQPISTMSTVASALAELVRARAIPPTVTTVLQAGEYLPQSLARELYATSNVSELINLCGATEDTIYSVSYDVPHEPTEDPPIGKAFLDRAIYVLDEDLNPVPPGTSGEICYGGSGVARGYLNRPELTAERFVPNPFGDSPRMYRSGDLVVEGPDGNIHYLRRNDQQVKISGYRIELGEIESVLREHPGVDQVAVIARTVGGHKTLAAYAVERTAGALDIDEVQAFVGARLPEYMVPSTLVLLDSMPFGPSGKLDRSALDSLERRRTDLAMEFIAPRNSYEERIAEAVAVLLGLDRVGVCDNFFALGGQSLLAARLVSDVQAMYPLEILELEKRAGDNALLTAFFVEPTVESLAMALGQGIATADEQGAATVPQRFRWVQHGDANRTPLFLFHGVIRGEAFYVWNLAQGLGADQPIYSIAPHGYQGEDVPDTIEAMAREYMAQVRHIQPHGPYHFAGYCNGGLIAFEIARMLQEEGETVETLVMISASARNTRFRGTHKTIEKLRLLPGFSEERCRALFLTVRGRLIALENADGSNPSLFCKLKRFFTRSESQSIENLAPEFNSISREARDERRYQEFLYAIDAYVPKRYGGKVRVIWGQDDIYGSSKDPFNGWREVSSAVDLHLVPGDHQFLETKPELIADYLRDLITTGAPTVEGGTAH
jgi:amino acid adenylation domain-containing protein